MSIYVANSSFTEKSSLCAAITARETIVKATCASYGRYVLLQYESNRKGISICEVLVKGISMPYDWWI